MSKTKSLLRQRVGAAIMENFEACDEEGWKGPKAELPKNGVKKTTVNGFGLNQTDKSSV